MRQSRYLPVAGENQSLYVISFANDTIKVGRSVNPDGRLRVHANVMRAAGVDAVATHAVRVVENAPDDPGFSAVQRLADCLDV